MVKENRKYKDSVFCDLFYEEPDAREHLLELYNALFGTQYSDPEIIDLVRLEEVLFKNFKNDVAFTVNNEHIILSEHQSTVNENMPLRSLMYIAREYERLVPIKERYRNKKINIPAPTFFTFYNGTDDYPVEKELRLSEAFSGHNNVSLELVVKVININPDKKHQILEKCKILKEYSQFVEIVRKYKIENKSLKDAIQECIERNILKDYLKKKGSEVINMLFAEYDYEMDIAVQRQESMEEGRKEGREEGERQKILNLVIKKLKKTYPVSRIAAETEESEERIQKIVDLIAAFAPEYDEKQIWQEIKSIEW